MICRKDIQKFSVSYFMNVFLILNIFIIIFTLISCASSRTSSSRTYSKRTFPYSETLCYPGKQEITKDFLTKISAPEPSVFSPKQPPSFPNYYVEDPKIIKPAAFPNEDVRAFADYLKQFTVIVGAKYQKDTGELILIGKEIPGLPKINPDDFFVAVRAAHIGEMPGVTIDPGPDTNTMIVKHFGKTENTHFGFVTFAADLFLKVGGFEFDNYNRELINVSLAGFESELDLMYEQPRGDKGSSWHRFWGEPSLRNVKLNRDKTAAIFKVTPHIKTEHIGGQKSKSAEASASAYADFLTNNYETLEKNYPVFFRLRQLFLIDTVVRWLIDNEYPVDKEWTKYKPQFVKTPQSIPAITVIRRGIKDNFRVALGIYGGISFQIKNQYRKGKETTDKLFGNAAIHKTASNNWKFFHNNEEYQAISWKIKNPIKLPKNQRWYVPKPQKVPQLQWVWQPNNTYSDGIIVFKNKTDRQLTLVFNNTAYELIIPVGGTNTQKLPPGTYDFFVSAFGVSPLRGQVNIKRNSKQEMGLFIKTVKY